MATVKDFVLENVSGAFCSIRVGDAVYGIAPKSVRPVSAFFKRAGVVDLEAARANESLKALIDIGAVKMVERDVFQRVGNTGRLWNENDPEETRIEKVLEHRRKVKEAAKQAPPVEKKRTVKE